MRRRWPCTGCWGSDFQPKRKGAEKLPREYYYDLHIHSCLSPCGDIDMTPNNIVNMAVIKGLELIALTDHNTCKNCPAVLQAAKGLPLAVLPGMELTTSEEIHVVFLFSGLENALAFDSYVHDRLPPVENRHEIFGEQIIMDGRDRVAGTEPYLLINATSISIDETWRLAGEFGGLCYPAHIDRASNSVLAALGGLPPHLPHRAVEIYRPELFFAREGSQAMVERFFPLTSSDAHTLTDIAEPERALALEEPDFHSLAALIGRP